MDTQQTTDLSEVRSGTDLFSVIPKIWADTLATHLQEYLQESMAALEKMWQQLPDWYREKYERKWKNRQHYLKKVAWAKAHPKRKRKVR